MTFELSSPTRSLAKCGMVSPIHPMVPLMQTEMAVTTVARTITRLRSLTTSTPRLLASLSLSDMALMRQPMNISTAQQTAITGMAIRRDSTDTFPRLPICQKVISTSSVSGVAMYLMNPRMELRKPPTIIPERTSARVVLFLISAGSSMHSETATMPPMNARDI